MHVMGMAAGFNRLKITHIDHIFVSQAQHDVGLSGIRFGRQPLRAEPALLAISQLAHVPHAVAGQYRAGFDGMAGALVQTQFHVDHSENFERCTCMESSCGLTVR
jgi:hypothetical protein